MLARMLYDYKCTHSVILLLFKTGFSVNIKDKLDKLTSDLNTSPFENKAFRNIQRL